MYAYSDFEVFQSEIQETFKLKFDDIYFLLDNAINFKKLHETVLQCKYLII